MSINNRISRNRNLYRKTQGYGPSTPPKPIEIVDLETGQLKTIDGNKVRRDRDFFKIPKEPFPIFLAAEYEEKTSTVVTFTEIHTIDFGRVFSEIPIVIITFNPPTALPDIYVNLHITNITTDQAVIAFSAPFTGSLLYKAIYSPVYPALVERQTYSPGTFVTASAGSRFIGQSDNQFISFDKIDPGLDADEFYMSTYSGEGMISGSFSSLTNDSTIAQFSAPVNSTLNYIAFKN